MIIIGGNFIKCFVAHFIYPFSLRAQCAFIISNFGIRATNKNNDDESSLMIILVCRCCPLYAASVVVQRISWQYHCFCLKRKKNRIIKKRQCTRIDSEIRPTEYLLISIIEAEKQPIWVENEKN